MGMTRVWAAVFMLFAGAALAATQQETFGLGPFDPVPERVVKMDEDLSIRLRILDSEGALATVVPEPEILQAELSFIAREGAVDREVRLICTASFMMADGYGSDDIINKRPCYRGRLSDATGVFVPLKFNLRFRPVATDQAGSSGVHVQIYDKAADKHLIIWATYDWQGGWK
jgi:hypothetical protein